MDKGNRDNTFTTLDAYLAGFLSLQGFLPELIQEKTNKIVFAFDFSEKLHQAIIEYNSGACVEASRLALAVKTLKSQIHSMRKNKAEQHGRKIPGKI